MPLHYAHIKYPYAISYTYFRQCYVTQCITEYGNLLISLFFLITVCGLAESTVSHIQVLWCTEILVKYGTKFFFSMEKTPLSFTVCQKSTKKKCSKPLKAFYQVLVLSKCNRNRDLRCQRYVLFESVVIFMWEFVEEKKSTRKGEWKQHRKCCKRFLLFVLMFYYFCCVDVLSGSPAPW